MTRNRTKVWDLNYVTVIMSATTKGYGCTRARVTEASELIAADVFTAFEKSRQRITFGDVERYLAQLANHSRDCGCGRCGLAPQPRSCSAWDPDLDSPKGTNRGEPATGGADSAQTATWIRWRPSKRRRRRGAADRGGNHLLTIRWMGSGAGNGWVIVPRATIPPDASTRPNSARAAG